MGDVSGSSVAARARDARDDVEFDPVGATAVMHRRRQGSGGEGGNGRTLRISGGQDDDSGRHLNDIFGDQDSPEWKRGLVIGACLLLALSVLFLNVTMRLILCYMSLLRPAWLTYSAADEDDSTRESMWLSYWIICGLLLPVDMLLLSKLPLPFLVTCTELLAIFLLSQNGARNSDLIYTEVIKPRFARHASTILGVTASASEFIDAISSSWLQFVRAKLASILRWIERTAASTNRSLGPTSAADQVSTGT